MPEYLDIPCRGRYPTMPSGNKFKAVASLRDGIIRFDDINHLEFWMECDLKCFLSQGSGRNDGAGLSVPPFIVDYCASDSFKESFAKYEHGKKLKDKLDKELSFDRYLEYEEYVESVKLKTMKTFFTKSSQENEGS